MHDDHVLAPEALGDERAVEAALRRGRHVVTANKALLAQDGPRLRGVAAAHGVSLLGSASVGGALPALETASRLRGVTTAFAGEVTGRET